MKPKLYVVGEDGGYSEPYLRLFDVTPNYQEAAVALFTGGEDVDPSVYGEQNVQSYSSVPRDQYEIGWFKLLKEAKIPMLGICRGAQLLTALTGGKLFQHVDNHGLRAGHDIYTETGEKYHMTSVHHQMMRPAGNYKLIAWTPKRSLRYVAGDGVQGSHELGKDPEIVFYPEIRALCIQGHPEYLPDNHRTNYYVRGLIKEYLL